MIKPRIYFIKPSLTEVEVEYATDADIPKLPPNKKIEGIFFVLDDADALNSSPQMPHPDLAGQVQIFGNIFEGVPEQDWRLLICHKLSWFPKTAAYRFLGSYAMVGFLISLWFIGSANTISALENNVERFLETPSLTNKMRGKTCLEIIYYFILA